MVYGQYNIDKWKNKIENGKSLAKMLPFNNDTSDTYREYRVDTKDQYLKILEFKRFVKHFSFKKISETYSQKELLEEITVVVALDVVERDTRNPSFINESKSSDR